MNFSSITAYLDPANWQQSATSAQFPPPPPPQPHGSGGAAGSIRPGSMTDRARLANIPLPESALKCPRCESTNTKFCYFNNYSLSQPRHFCKTCRRYWTRGGALRNVPVGGGCRRDHRRSKGSSSKSSASNDRAAAASGSPSTISSGNPDILGIGPNFSPLQFMAPLHQLSEFGDIGMNYSRIAGISAPLGAVNDLNFQLGSNILARSSDVTVAGSSGLDQWQLQQTPQFPILGFGSDSSSGLYPFDQTVTEHLGYGAGQIRPKFSGSVTASQSASVKMEERLQELNLSRQFLGVAAGNEQYWGGNAWTDHSSFRNS